MLMVGKYCKINVKTRLIYFDIASSSEYQGFAKFQICGQSWCQANFGGNAHRHFSSIREKKTQRGWDCTTTLAGRSLKFCPAHSFFYPLIVITNEKNNLWP